MPKNTPTTTSTIQSDTPVQIQHDGRILTLKTAEERANLSENVRNYLATFFPACNEQRDRQLDYILDPFRAADGFEDYNGYEPPVGDVEHIIKYNLTEEEMVGGVEGNTQIILTQYQAVLLGMPPVS
jgi:hypothetical protein